MNGQKMTKNQFNGQTIHQNFRVYELVVIGTWHGDLLQDMAHKCNKGLVFELGLTETVFTF